MVESLVIYAILKQNQAVTRLNRDNKDIFLRPISLSTSSKRQVPNEPKNGRFGGKLCGNLPEKSNFAKKEESSDTQNRSTKLL